MPSDISQLLLLEELHLGHNMISDIADFKLLSRLSSLQTLRLYGNDITTVSEEAVENLKHLANLSTFYMGDNPYNCTCDVKAFATWLKDTYVEVGLQWHFPKNGIPYKSSDFDGNEPAYKCASPPTLFDVSLLVVSQMNCPSPEIPTTMTTENSSSSDDNDNGGNVFSWSPITIGLMTSFMFVAMILVFTGVVYSVKAYRKKRRHVGIFPHIDNNDNPMVNNVVAHQFKYDAYICHHDNLVNLVVYNFMTRLEQEPNNLQLCLSFRDFIIGADKLDNITDAFETCRSTIFLIDENFVNSNQCMLELKICCSYLLDDNRPADTKQNGIIMIVLDAIPRDRMPTTLRVLMNKITYLEWNRLDDEKCWRQLEASLRRIKVE
ncbi:toll-like receptor 6 [Amphiura filiformis]|uniref:toll-like receptor 6 n=1 Tax=Amphiura filiformis TaxID=82378 RepID=UPI003B226C10